MTGIETASMISATFDGSAIRATPPSARMSAGTRSSAMTATAPASSAILAWSAVVTSMITPPFNISANPDLTRNVPVSRSTAPPSCAVTQSSVAKPRADPEGLLAGLDLEALGEQLDPGVPGRERDDVAGLRLELRHVRGLRTNPLAHDHAAVPEDVRLPGPRRHGLRRERPQDVLLPRVDDLHHLDDHIVGRDLLAVLQRVRH